jgi:hypothetical protein
LRHCGGRLDDDPQLQQKNVLSWTKREAGASAPQARRTLFAVFFMHTEDAMAFRTLFLSRLLGLFFLICGLAMLLHKQVYTAAVATVAYDPMATRWIGIIIALAGLAMVLAHNVWSKPLVAIVVTVLGWLTLIKGMAYLFLPTRWLEGFFQAMLNCEGCVYLVMAFLLVLGAYLTYQGFESRPA